MLFSNVTWASVDVDGFDADIIEVIWLLTE